MLMVLKAKASETKRYPLYLVNISKIFTVDNLKKSGLKGHLHDFSVGYDTVNVSDVEDNHKYLMKNTILHKFLDSLSKCSLF